MQKHTPISFTLNVVPFFSPPTHFGRLFPLPFPTAALWPKTVYKKNGWNHSAANYRWKKVEISKASSFRVRIKTQFEWKYLKFNTFISQQFLKVMKWSKTEDFKGVHEGPNPRNASKHFIWVRLTPGVYGATARWCVTDGWLDSSKNPVQIKSYWNMTDRHGGLLGIGHIWSHQMWPISTSDKGHQRAASKHSAPLEDQSRTDWGNIW